MKKLVAVFILAGAMVATHPLSAQSKDSQDETGLRSVQGTVTDNSGAPVDGAAVHLKNTKTLQIRSYITKSEGSYSFHGLSTNVDYELKAEAQGASSDVKRLSVFDSRNSAVINLKIKK